MESCFTFEDGDYIGYERLISNKLVNKPNDIKPEDFVISMNPEMVRILIGQRGNEYIEDDTGLKLLVFEEKQLLCVFDNNDELLNVVKSKETFADE